jgi:1,2-phenylacetyl-CoA epoxidase catalytic subunit
MARLKEALTVLKTSVDRLGSARSILTDEAIGQLGRRAADTLLKLRDCSANVGQIPPHGPLGNQTVEASETGQPPAGRP